MEISKRSNKLHFKRIALFGKHSQAGIADTLEHCHQFLKKLDLEVSIETETAKLLKSCKLPKHPANALAKHADLVIVVGGDGSLLTAARALNQPSIPILGINRGRLGFLADIHPDDLEHEVKKVIYGEYLKEKRFLISGTVKRGKKIIKQALALNDIVLYPGEISKMVEFEVSIDQEFIYQQRADGLIISTPTGSTAYALSAGGPILHPHLDALVLVPMFPHTLSSRPIVVHGDSKILLKVSQKNTIHPRLSFDSQEFTDLAPDDTIEIQKTKNPLQLIHPSHYQYYDTLRTKLHWGKAPSKAEPRGTSSE